MTPADTAVAVVPPRAIVEVDAYGDANIGIGINRVVFDDGAEYRRVGRALICYPSAEHVPELEGCRIRSAAVKFEIRRRWWREEEAKQGKI